MVLLRNDGVLPLRAERLRSLALIGPNAGRAQIMGGGSAKLRPHRLETPLDALRARLGDAVEIVHERGCEIDRTVPPLALPFTIEFHAGPDLEGDPVHRRERGDGLLIYTDDALPGGMPADDCSFRARARFVAEHDGVHTFTLVQAGTARVLVDGRVVVDGVTDPPPRGEQLIGMASEEIGGDLELSAGQAVDLVVEYSCRGAPSALRGVQVGCRAPVPPDQLERAVAAARAADAVVLVVGTNDDWETEGSDRASMDLPGAQDELIERVLAVRPDAVVVVNTGAPVTMGWAERAGAVLQAWFGGQEMGGALAAVLLGDAEPGGRLPTTIPLRVEHNPSYGNFPGENGEVRYGEGVLIGYRSYEARELPVRFPFGHGLSYTTFAIGAPEISGRAPVTVRVPVTNTGDRPGAEVVQCYVAPPASPLVRPPRELKAFAKVRLEPGESATVTLELDERAFAYWDPGDPGWPALAPRLAASPLVRIDPRRRTEGGWRVDPGRYELHVGRSSADVSHVVELELQA
jgi:beta-glucosidase